MAFSRELFQIFNVIFIIIDNLRCLSFSFSVTEQYENVLICTRTAARTPYSKRMEDECIDGPLLIDVILLFSNPI